MSTLEIFLRTGKLGPIQPGVTTLGETETVLGATEDLSTQNRPKIAKYGSLQLAFDVPPGEKNAVLASVNMYWKPPLSFPRSLDLSALPEPWARLDFESWCAERNLGPLRAMKEFPDNFVLPSGAIVVFDNGQLYGLFVRAPLRPVEKQLSVTLPDPTWQKVKIVAKQRQISPAQLCREWIDLATTNVSNQE